MRESKLYMANSRKIKHKVYTRHSGGKTPDIMYKNLMKQAILMTLRSEGIGIPCVVNVLITDDKGICEYNRDYRGINKSTDVLSFPMQTFTQAGWRSHGDLELDESTGELPLGDILISTQTVRRQAKEFNSTIKRETTYLIIHSSLHLLGYDHDNVSTAYAMRSKEKELLKKWDTLIKGNMLNDK